VNPLFLSGFGVSLCVDRARLMVKDGHLMPDTTLSRHEIQPRHVPFDSIVIDSQTGQISIPAIKWLMRHGVPLFILDYNGTLLSSTLPREPVVGNLKKAQIEAHQDPEKRFYIARAIVEAKLERTRDLVEWFGSRYEIDQKSISRLGEEIRRFEGCRALKDLLLVEGRVAEVYWKIFQTLIPKKCGFISRMHETHQMNSTDPVNTLLNYGYAFLESRCRASINAVGLEPSIGFLHEIAQPKYPLVYDLQEPFRWIIDKTILSCIENDTFSKRDFFLTDNYVLRLLPSSIKKLLQEVRLPFNSRIEHKARNYCWDTIIRLKSTELARYILRKTSGLDFSRPTPDLFRPDTKDLRKEIMSLSVSQARKIGIKKNTLWYLKDRANQEKPFKIYAKIERKLDDILP